MTHGSGEQQVCAACCIRRCLLRLPRGAPCLNRGCAGCWCEPSTPPSSKRSRGGGAVPVFRLPSPGSPRVLLGLVEVSRDAVGAHAVVRHLEHPPEQRRAFVNQLVTCRLGVPSYPRRE